jgi:hypothetical protein
MDKTANSTFSSRSNAKRAAEKLLAAGTAPAVDYGINERQDGRFEIKWKTTPVSTGVSEPPASTVLSQDEPASTGEPVPPPASPTTTRSRREITQAAAQGDPAPAAAEDPELAAFETPRLIAELARRGYRDTQARRPRAKRPAKERQWSKTKLLDEAAGRGVMPTNPDVTSPANKHYQKRLDKLAGLAAAGDWDAVAGYECNGVNSYSKMVRQYRDRLVAAYKAQRAAATATNQGAAQ